MRKIMIAIAALIAMGSGAFAQTPTKIVISYSPVFDVALAFVAKEQGFFAKRGLDVEFNRVVNGSVTIAGLVAGTTQVGTPTISVILQASEADIDLAVISGLSNLGKTTQKTLRLINRKGFDPKQPSDYIGKKIGVAGLGATLEILFKDWLRRNNVEAGKVTVVEVPFAGMPDALKGSMVDAVVSVEPFVTRTAQVSEGTIGASISEGLPRNMPAIVFVTSRAWADKNPTAVQAFREAIAESLEFILKNDEAMRQDANKYLKLPTPIIAKLDVPDFELKVDPDGITKWSEIMVSQGDLKKKVADPARLILK